MEDNSKEFSEVFNEVNNDYEKSELKINRRNFLNETLRFFHLKK